MRRMMDERDYNGNSTYYERLMSACSLVNGDFCIDWLVDLMIGMKPSHILGLLQEGVSDGTLLEKAPGYYSFAGVKKRKKWQSSLSTAEQAEFDDLGHQRTIDVLNTPASDLFTLAPVTAAIPQKARIEPSAPCSHCGEPTMATKLATVEGRPVCRGCLASSAAGAPSRQMPSRQSSPA